MDIRILTTKAEMAPLFSLVHQLSPWITEERYLALLEEMLPRGYRIIAVFERDACVALSGIWTGAKFYCGRYLEMDNVIVDERHRSAGLGQMLCAAAEKLASAEGIETLMLDAYRENERAHRFYERQGYLKRGFHFVKPFAGWALDHHSPMPEHLR